MTYIIIAVLLLAVELLYFRIADKCNIIDKPNERSCHTKVVLRGGGIIFTIGLWIWSAFFGFQYPWLLAGVTLAAGISFVDDIYSFIARLTAFGGAVYVDVLGVPRDWTAALGYVVDYTNCIGCSGRRDEHI